MEYRPFGKLNFKVSPVGLGTWVMGGWLWGGARDEDSEGAIEASIEAGINFIDTAPVYGFGRSEQVVGKVIKRLGVRDRVVVATKCGLEWNETNGMIRRNSKAKRIRKEIDSSRKRLQTDVIDLYQIHWPDESVPFCETVELLGEFFVRGWIRGIGVSNFDIPHLEEGMKGGCIHSLQPPFNLFERDIENDLLSYCRKKEIAVVTYGALCRGLLTNKFDTKKVFQKGDVRVIDPKFQPGRFEHYLQVTRELKAYADSIQVDVAAMAIRWATLKPGVTVALAGARDAVQAKANAKACLVELTSEQMREIEKIVESGIPNPVGTEFMGPPRNIPVPSTG
ncbi:MAG: aldo/keto reductase [Candidatus Omnitrophica bacterium]|nr:aldo/keto reductase [Candidatus Omnitrophota bacterium]